MTRGVFSLPRGPATWDPGANNTWHPGVTRSKGNRMTGSYQQTNPDGVVRIGKQAAPDGGGVVRIGQFNHGYISHENELKRPTPSSESGKSPKFGKSGAAAVGAKPESRLQRFFRSGNQRRKSESQKSDYPVSPG